MDRLRAWVDGQFSSICDEFFHFLRFKTVSTDPAYLDEHSRCTAWLTHLFQEMQFKVETIETSGLPLFYAENLTAGKSAPTVLVYGHYDVQPPEPLELWESAPFEPDIRDGEIYARGVSDDKGQMFAYVKAIEAFFRLKGSLPVNVKLVGSDDP